MADAADKINALAAAATIACEVLFFAQRVCGEFATNGEICKRASLMGGRGKVLV